MLTISRLRLAVHLGFYEAERNARQPVELCLRLYFPVPPACASDDHAQFIDYGMLCQEISKYVEARRFRLVEFMASDLFAHMRQFIDAKGGSGIGLWLKLNKCEAPVPNLQGGASFVLCDLPPGATTVADWS